MTFCGHHPKMDLGLGEFGEGVATAVQNRQERDNLSDAEVRSRELTEMSNLNDALANEGDGSRKKALQGLSMFIGAVFEIAAKRTDTPFHMAIEEEVRAVAALIEPMEKEARRLMQVGGTMADLAKWVAQQ